LAPRKSGKIADERERNWNLLVVSKPYFRYL